MKPTRTFSANVGDYSVGNAGADAIENDIDTINRMLDPLTEHAPGQPGGIGTVNLQNDSVTDDIMGNRVFDENTAVAYGNSGKITQIFSWFAKSLKSMKGTASWNSATTDTMEGLYTRIMQNKASLQALNVAVDNNAAYIDGKVNGIAGAGRTTQTVKGNADQIASATTQINNHTTDAAIHITQSEKEVLDSVVIGGGGYVLPKATSAVLGGVKQGSNVVIDENGVISVNAPETDSVKFFGAIGDGIADDTVAIQTALDVAGVNKTSVLIDDGIYKTTGTLTIPYGVTVKGVTSRGATIQYYANGVAVKFQYDTTAITLENLTIERKTATITNTIGLLLESNLFCKVNNVRILSFETGLRIDGRDKWCATNYFYEILTYLCKNGVIITADIGKQSNHNIFIGGYICGETPLAVGTKGVFIERGDSNMFYGTAVEDYDIGYHFLADDSFGNGAVCPRAENCNITYLIGENTTNTTLIAPYGVIGIQNNSSASLILSRMPSFRADNICWSNNFGIKFRDSGGMEKEVFKVTNTNDINIKMPSFSPNKVFSVEIADIANVHQKEIEVTTELVKARKYLKLGTVLSLPVASETYRGMLITIQGEAGIDDKNYFCRKKIDNTYEWKQIDSDNCVTVKDQNTLTGVTNINFWTGTQAEYDAIGVEKLTNNVLYLIKS